MNNMAKHYSAPSILTVTSRIYDYNSFTLGTEKTIPRIGGEVSSTCTTSKSEKTQQASVIA